jgi:hypothetical protein
MGDSSGAVRAFWSDQGPVNTAVSGSPEFFLLVAFFGSNLTSLQLLP